MSKAIETRDLSLRVNGQPVGPIPVPSGPASSTSCTSGWA